MKKYIEAYLKTVQAFIDNELSSASSARIEEVLKEFETKTAYFQHERLIHLIVTVLFAIMEMMSIYTLILSANVSVVVFCVMFLVLLVPYVMHYYFLENSVQQMYRMRDTIVSSLRKKL